MGNLNLLVCAVKFQIACKVWPQLAADIAVGRFHTDDGVSNIGLGCLLIGACLVDIIMPRQI